MIHAFFENHFYLESEQYLLFSPVGATRKNFHNVRVKVLSPKYTTIFLINHLAIHQADILNHRHEWRELSPFVKTQTCCRLTV